MADVNAGSFSTDSYASWQIGPDTPLAAIAGGTGVENPEGATLTFSGDTVLTPSVNLATGLTVAAVSGCSAPSIIGLQVIKGFGSAAGDPIDVVCSISFTASSATAVFDITVPTATTANFAGTGQANGVAVVTSGTSGGSLTSIATVNASKSVRVTLALGGSSGTYTANLIFTYIVAA